ncbi:MAG: hypothetical protein IT317_05945 [Anaerolineales bacterium]|nr:hypothetical protein [Anaerolineales bacterium]
MEPSSPPAAGPLVVTLRPRAVALSLWLTLAALVLAASVAALLARANGGPLPDSLARRFSLYGSAGLPLVFGGALLAAIAGVCALNAAQARARRARAFWGLSALLALAALFDELALLHSALTPAAAELAARLGAGAGWRAGAWLVGGLAGAAGLGALAWLARGVLPRRALGALSAWAALFGLGLVGAPLLVAGFGAAGAAASRWAQVALAAAGALKPAGLAGLLAALLAETARTHGPLRWQLAGPPQAGSARLTPRQAATALGAALAVLSGLYFGLFVVFAPRSPSAALLAVMGRLDMDREQNLPTIFGALLLGAAAALLAGLARAAYRERDWLWLRWAALAAAFAFLTVDEVVSWHEMLVKPVRSALNVSGLLGFAWYIPAAPLVAAFGLFCLELLRRLPRRTAWLFALAGAVYVGAAIGVEMVGALLQERVGRRSLLYLLEVGCEETLEMAGAVLFIYALLDYAARRWGAVVVAVGRREGAGTALCQNGNTRRQDDHDPVLGA